MTGFEFEASDVGSDRSTNCDTTTAHNIYKFYNLKGVSVGLTTSKHCLPIS